MSHYLTLIIVTLIALMAAIWLGFYMAREITTPIRRLAEGTLKVAGGDYDIHIDQEGRDEIGFLVQVLQQDDPGPAAEPDAVGRGLPPVERSPTHSSPPRSGTWKSS